jgi:GMP synthase (glutamine-hydrolysing)
MATTIGILRMSELPAVSYAVHGPHIRLFEMMFEGRDVALLDIPVCDGAAPASLDDADVWIATGSPASVYDGFDWIATAEEIVREAARTESAFVGICFGHQLVAQALGGRVAKAEGGWCIGATDYTTVRPDAAPAGVPMEMTLLASHQDQVLGLPDDAVVWATADHCPNAALRVGNRMWTVQGHPEFTPQLVRAVYDSRRDRIGDDKVDAAIATLDRPLSSATVVDAILTQVTKGDGPLS